MKGLSARSAALNQNRCNLSDCNMLMMTAPHSQTQRVKSCCSIVKKKTSLHYKNVGLPLKQTLDAHIQITHCSFYDLTLTCEPEFTFTCRFCVSPAGVMMSHMRGSCSDVKCNLSVCVCRGCCNFDYQPSLLRRSDTNWKSHLICSLMCWRRFIHMLTLRY